MSTTPTEQLTQSIADLNTSLQVLRNTEASSATHDSNVTDAENAVATAEASLTEAKKVRDGATAEVGKAKASAKVAVEAVIDSLNRLVRDRLS